MVNEARRLAQVQGFCGITLSRVHRRPAGWPGESGSRLPQSISDHQIMSLAILGGDFIEGKAGDGFHPGGGGFQFEGGGTAPLPLRGQRHQAVMTLICSPRIDPSVMIV